MLSKSGNICHAASAFNAIHRKQISNDNVVELMEKFKRTGSAGNASRFGTPTTGEGTSTQVLVTMNRQQSEKRDLMALCKWEWVKTVSWTIWGLTSGIHTSCRCYTIWQRVIQTIGILWVVIEHKQEYSCGFVSSPPFFSDEANFYVSGDVNKQIMRHRWIAIHTECHGLENSWCEETDKGDRDCWSFFFHWRKPQCDGLSQDVGTWHHVNPGWKRGLLCIVPTTQDTTTLLHFRVHMVEPAVS